MNQHLLNSNVYAMDATAQFYQRLKVFGDAASEIIPGIQRGIEKESLRISKDGYLSQKSHPHALGSALTHPYITTDYSESLIELVTPTAKYTKKALNFLTKLHWLVYHHCSEELLWVNSLPCVLGDDSMIRIAEYGNSNIGRMKHVYRNGLGLRYGRKMQVIAGIHYNISVPEEFWNHCSWQQDANPQNTISNGYMAGTRNFHRYCWLLFYLFGASPAGCRSFFDSNEIPGLSSLDNHTVFGQYATSLRMSNIGYRNPVQSEIRIDHNSVDGYIDSLCRTVNTSYPMYENFGVKQGEKYVQLNSNLLQIENEYYSVIRPKRRIKPLEKPTRALKERGVEYLELRCVDLDPFEPIGISEQEARFMDLFVVYCLLYPSPPLTESQLQVITSNKDTTVVEGRKPNQTLIRDDSKTKLTDWAIELLDQLEAIAEVFESAGSAKGYIETVRNEREKIYNPQLTPSAKVLNEIIENKESFFNFAMRKANESRSYFEQYPLSDESREKFRTVAQKSIDEQAKIEEEDKCSFDEFLDQYFSRQ